MSLPIPHVPDVPFLPSSRKAAVGFTFGLLSLVFGIFASIPALIFSVCGLREVKADPARVSGRGRAYAGIIAAVVGLVLQPILLYFVVVPFVRDRIYRAESADNLHRIGQAMIDHADNDFGRMLRPLGWNAKEQPLLSWRVALLPDLGEKELYEQFHLDEPWDSPHNAPLVRRMPKVYAHPADPGAAAQGLTYYRVFFGERLPFNDPYPMTVFPAAFVNGTSQTILVAEAADPVPWTKPDELRYDPKQPIPKLGGLLRGGFNVVMANGTTHFVRYDVKEETLRQAIGEERDWGTNW